MFKKIADQALESSDGINVRIWGNLPFYAKFLGDGILFLWNTNSCGGFSGLCNIVIQLYNLTDEYKSEFIPIISKSVVKPPKLLRCGIARGQIISIGNGQDFVG